MSIEFPLRRKQTAFGPVSDPKIPIDVRTTDGPRRFMFLIDTGADLAVAPRRLADQVGLDWNTLPTSRLQGVEGSGVRARVGDLPLRVGDVELAVRCLFLDTPKGFFLLGRADFLDRFRLTIDPARQTIRLDEIPA